MSIAKTNAFELNGVSSQTTPSEDALLVERVKAGDTVAFDELIRKYRTRLYSTLYNMLGNREDAMDLTQDAFIKAFSSINSFRGTCAFYTWLYRIAINMGITFLKRSRMRRFFSFDNPDEEIASAEVLEKLSVNCGGGRKAAILSEIREKLNEALQTLSIKHRTVVILYEIEGLSHQEIAEITNSTPATVRTRLHYAKQQLQSILKDYIS